ncbi:Plant disease resistance response protein [Corchorus olitorius]|uniref:Dirigent protein n=1 Tax=Corchorus olitorius TaxID=93759 RepID=A0A1R3JDB3_9ROSI|nr:Plant disease resistance response protein [Corchorus olitorius]
MNRSLILAWILVLCTAAIPCCQGYYSKTVAYKPRRQKVTHLHFFLHDTMNGNNPSAIVVARPNITSRTNFGNIVVADDPLTVGPDVKSEVIGNAQGLLVPSGQNVLSLTALLDFEFTKGEFNGSSISVFSRNPITQRERQLAVVGGRGKFAMATGVANLTTYFGNLKGDAIVEYHVTVIHY